MKEIRCVEGSLACAEAVKRSKVDIVCAYPITPQTHIVEFLAKFHADGEMDADFINCESEHSALSICAGASATGARTFTATAGQGLALMHEILFICSGMRLPVVMAVTNRALSAPLSIWGDHSDALSSRDSGWIQIFCSSSQEIFDSTVQAFRIAESVFLPLMLNFDGFLMSHLYERAIIEDRVEVEEWVGEFSPRYYLHPDRPVAMGCFASPDFYMEFKRQQEEAMKGALKVLPQVSKDFARTFGREYGFLEKYRIEDAETIILLSGSLTGNAKEAIDELRKEGEKIGLVRLRVYRPFPRDELKRAVGDSSIICIDRHFSPGFGPPLTSEVRSSVKNSVVGFVAGLGGRDLRKEDFVKIYREALKCKPFDFRWYGVRE